jgi:hypothetical protein
VYHRSQKFTTIYREKRLAEVIERAQGEEEQATLPEPG